MNPQTLSVVVPVYKCGDCLDELINRIESISRQINLELELLLVDDRSPDGAWSTIVEIAASKKSVRGIRLSRNFGQHYAITAGIQESRGDYVIVMDCDLQDPPELIEQMVALAEHGAEIVLARRIEREHSLFRRISARIYFWLLSFLSGRKIDGSFGNFSLMSRKVADEFLRFRERDRHFMFIVGWLGFEPSVIDYAHRERHSGSSSYSISGLVRHAVGGLFFQTTRLLRMIAYIGIALNISGFVAAIWVVLRAVGGETQSGWASLIVAIFISTGAVLLSIGVIGVYIEKLFDEMKQRPLFVVAERTHYGEPRSKYL